MVSLYSKLWVKLKTVIHLHNYFFFSKTDDQKHLQEYLTNFSALLLFSEEIAHESNIRTSCDVK